MKMIVAVALALVAVVAAAPVQDTPVPQTLRSSFEQKPDGEYQSSFETENGIAQSETGELKQVPGEDNKPVTVVVVRGSYSYSNNEGTPVKVVYYADETGFHAEGDTIPKATSI